MWNGLMKVLEIQHRDKNGNIIWEDHNLLNVLHLRGEEFLLRVAFTGGKVSDVIPENYYLGLDNRSLVNADDEMTNLIGEPNYAGYERQPISSAGDFSVHLTDGHYQALSPVVAFGSLGGVWGPVSNLFLSDGVGTGHTLISTVQLNTPIVVQSGESVTMRLGMKLRDC